MNLDSDKIISRIRKYDIVTFDVFDTLIVRDVMSYRDFVSLMNIKYQQRTGNKLPFMFYRRRVHAPKPAGKKLGGREASIDDIYNVLNMKDKDIIKEIELETELEIIAPNPEMMKVYQYCIDNHKKVCCISDMYLKKEHIKNMLNQCGYYIDDIYVSQEYGVSKLNGGLFKEFLKEKGYSPDKVIHIGDSFKADFEGAGTAGIQSVHIERNINRLRYTKVSKLPYKVNDRILYKFVNDRIDSLDNNLERAGYEVLGPVLYYFVSWLDKTLKENGLDNIFFCSRDGYLMREAYNIINGQKGKYIFVSRKSVENAYKKCGKQYENLQGYLKDSGFTQKSILIDIGWSGNMHKMITDIMKDISGVYGFYFGTFRQFRKNVTDGISGGYLQASKMKMLQVYMNAGFIETLFSDTCSGTTLEFKKENGKYLPQCSGANPDGSKLRSIQKGALKFVKDWKASAYSDYISSLNQNYLINPLLRFCMCPERKDLDSMKGENYGQSDRYESLIDEKKAGGFLAKFPGLKDACWKGAYLSMQFDHKSVSVLYKYLNMLRLINKI